MVGSSRGGEASICMCINVYKYLLSKLDAIIQNQKVLYENQIVIFQTLASIGQKVYSQSDFKSLMINMVANGITERVEANDQQRRNI